ncbi:MFS transporter [Loigolactobacillus coryniformis]|uniref:MFS transporter n=1 Tax=Loigolactobacillus coryniformis TaxID=1610 RepID=UPI002151C025|nr:MFS transporter [Loigolactobacillus coryniformis]
MPFKLNQNTSWRLNFYLIFSGQFMSGLTTMIVQYAFMWYITDVLKSATALSLSTLMMFLPWIFLAPVAGVVIDHWSKKAIMIGMDLLAALVAIIISVTIGQFAGDHWPICWWGVADFIISGNVDAGDHPSFSATNVKYDRTSDRA